MIQKFDLHIHSNKSDGKFSIEDIIMLLRLKGIEDFSITDHDSVDSIEIVKKCDLEGLNYTTGVEMSSISDKYKAHILGYGIDGNLEQLRQLCNKVRETRIRRLYERVHYLRSEFGINLSEVELAELIRRKNESGEPISERRDLGQVLVTNGICSSMREAYKKYLEYEDYLTTYRVDARTVIEAIHTAGGKAILAHPIQMEKKYGIDITEMIGDFIKLGIDGIEVFNSKHMNSDCARYYRLAKEKRLLISGGSDFHQETSTFLGKITGDTKEVNIGKEHISLLSELSKERNYNYDGEDR